jgi:hypothetical protein
MPRRKEGFIAEIDKAAELAAIMPANELQALFRRAAIRLRNLSGLILDADVDAILTGIALETGESKQDLVRRIIREWMLANDSFSSSSLDAGKKADEDT